MLRRDPDFFGRMRQAGLMAHRAWRIGAKGQARIILRRIKCVCDIFCRL